MTKHVETIEQALAVWQHLGVDKNPDSIVKMKVWDEMGTTATAAIIAHRRRAVPLESTQTMMELDFIMALNRAMESTEIMEGKTDMVDRVADRIREDKKS